MKVWIRADCAGANASAAVVGRTTVTVGVTVYIEIGYDTSSASDAASITNAAFRIEEVPL